MTGRPKAFDEHEVIDRAQRVFWRRGYTAASTEELLAAMGIGKGSFYLAFPGGKKELFEKSIQQFHRESFRQLEELVMASAQPVEVIKDYFRAIATAAPEAHERGCYLANSVMEMSSLDLPLQKAAGLLLKQLESLFFTVIQQAKASGQLTSPIDARLLAQHLLTLWNGLSITRRLYPDNAQLRQLVDLQLTVLT
ncbi:TetR/AcrR family transcriptional regulator [Hymenobacter sp. YC55]|uniref:TetR/AcrR family transcriptional regulator n=1 Tax=Hymenobacter sp. YC55 TaxID=3034019 RepID=UPI0023F900CC|nr:TetR/AcrR family transcriptional regulator [Hymenobacter sp. YC55]MDF7814216.1 TetR/AcrR family transcriptional regulator [Hymenobacter sp. YC55]